MDKQKLLKALGLGIAIYSTTVWAYITLMAYLIPQTQYEIFSIFIPVESNLLAEIAFVLGFVGFVLFKYFSYIL